MAGCRENNGDEKRENYQETDERKQSHVINLSGGKDSTAALILMIEHERPIDMVIN